MSRRKQVIEDVEIVDIAHKGQAIGKSPSGEIVILLDNAAPGDRVNMAVTKKKKGVKHGRIKETIFYSPHRVSPQCQHFGTCGGCKWQHLDYHQQVHHKENAVRQAIKRIARDDETKVSEIVAASKIYEYRNKLEYTFSTKRWLTEDEVHSGEDFSDRSGLGFHISGAFDKVLDIETCHLQEDLSNRVRNTLRSKASKYNWPYYDIRKNTGFLRNIIVRNSTLDQWMITFIFGECDRKMIEEVISVMQESFPTITSWNYIVNTKQNSSFHDLPVHHAAGQSFIEEKLGTLSYRISPKSFFQTNSHQAKKLYDVAVAMADLKKSDIVYDLYTGTGSIALYLSGKCHKVVGIEVIEEAINDARINAEINEIVNATFLVGDVKDVLDPSFRQVHGQPDVIVTDPPRAGMHADVVSTILSLTPDKIVYISCNPSTQARDILLLKDKYELVEVIPVDMFPHTSHIESVALLTLADR